MADLLKDVEFIEIETDSDSSSVTDERGGGWAQDDGNGIIDVSDDSSSDDDDLKEIKVEAEDVDEIITKTAEQCKVCRQALDETTPVIVRREESEEEKTALDKFPLTISEGNLNEKPSLYIHNYAIYDKHNHQIPLDAGLIGKKGVTIYFYGTIKAPWDDEDTPGVFVQDCKIDQWWLTGLPPGEQISIGLSTHEADYYVQDPSEEYARTATSIGTELKLLKNVYELLSDAVEKNEDLKYETMVECLAKAFELDGQEFSEELLWNSAPFIIDQIASYERNADEDEETVLESTALKKLARRVNLDLSSSRQREDRDKRAKKRRIRLDEQESDDDIEMLSDYDSDDSEYESRRRPRQVRRRPKISDKPPSKATTTPLVRHLFATQFNTEIDDMTPGHRGCGTCEACRKPDCGHCLQCRQMTKFNGTSTDPNLLCDERQCPHTLDIIVETNEERLVRDRENSANIDWPEDPKCELGERDGCTFYDSVYINKVLYKIGDYVEMRNPESDSDETFFCKILQLYSDGPLKVGHARWFYHGRETILMDTADKKELFACFACEDIELTEVIRKISVTYNPVPSNWAAMGGSESAIVAPLDIGMSSTSYWYRFMYDPKRARYETVPSFMMDECDTSGMACQSCPVLLNNFLDQEPAAVKNDKGEIIGFKLRGERYLLNDGLMLEPKSIDMPNRQKKGFRNNKKQQNLDPKVYTEMYRKRVKKSNSQKGDTIETGDTFDIVILEMIAANPVTKKLMLTVRPLLRPENTQYSWDEVCQLDFNILFWTDEMEEIKAEQVAGKCHILPYMKLPTLPTEWSQQGPCRFYYEQMYNKVSHDVEPLPLDGNDYEPASPIPDHPQLDKPLNMMDIFSGCGGLSMGLEASGLAKAKWAIEFDEYAAEAFRLNHPDDCEVIVEDCNKVLKEIMDGKPNCRMPKKGEVDIMVGGPPCQGFSVLNSFPEREASRFKSSLISSYLSYCDYYRPKYFILENVRNFACYSGGQVLRLCARALVMMGYQCTFGIMQAGNFGVPQDRKRTFLLAASPEVTLPHFPSPDHVFQKMAMGIKIGDRQHEVDSKWKNNAAPYRNILVRDALKDLPDIEGGRSYGKLEYKSDPMSHFQRLVRYDKDSAKFMTSVMDQEANGMSPIVTLRISLIPLYFGADWRDLPNISMEMGNGVMAQKLKYFYKDKNGWPAVCKCATLKGIPKAQDCLGTKQDDTIVPWGLVHKANTNNQFRGLYSRIHFDSYFSTTITNIHPSGKQGRVVHPEQHRVVSVRECARSQGFHDSTKFAGTNKERYRQIGNAVPPPLGKALGIAFLYAYVNQERN